MKKPALLIISLLLSAMAFAGQEKNLHTVTDSAALAYADGRFLEAASLYEKVLSEGYESAGLYFNLGNSYFKLNNIPAAILFYEKAAKLDPRDENIRFNLELANSRIIDKIEPLPEFFLKSWYRGLRQLMPSDGWAMLAVASYMLLLTALFIFLVSGTALLRKLSFFTGIVLLFVLSLSLIFSVQAHREYTRSGSAIIFTPTVTVKSSPNDNSVDLFVIHEGTKVSITDRVENWSEVRLANGNVGWIKTETFRTI